MANQTTYPVLSVFATNGGRLSDLAIKDGQLIFVQDSHKIALDFNGKRKFYNQIVELETEQERQELPSPESGMYYFVIGTAVLWYYHDKWIQITTPPKEILFIGTTLPELGSEQTLYVDTHKKEISVWDPNAATYLVVANNTVEMSAEDIDALFL